MDIEVLGSGSRGNAYLVDMGGVRILLEAGLSWSQMQTLSGFTMSNVDACLISHEHGDHAAGVTAVMRNGIDVYTSEGTATALGIEHDHHCRIVRPNATFQLYPGYVKVMALPVEHDAAEPFAWLIRDERTGEMLLFATDTPYMPYNIAGLTHAMVEANYSAELMEDNDASLNTRVMRTHMSIDALEEWIRGGKAAGTLEQIYLLHLSDDRSNADEFKRRVQELTGAAVYVA